MVIKAANGWKNNSELILDVLKLGYIKPYDNVLDVTYGKGNWWKTYSPSNFVYHDIKIDGVDFRRLPEDNNTFDVVAYDPPYVSKGGRKTSSIQKFDEAYGIDVAPQSPQELQTMINEGLKEVYRVVKPKGYVLVKCMNYISSGKTWDGIYETRKYADQLGFNLAEQFIHYGEPRMQPKRTRKDGKQVKQKHARNNYSVLFVFQKGKNGNVIK